MLRMNGQNLIKFCIHIIIDKNCKFPTELRLNRRSKHPKEWLRHKALKKETQKTCRVTHDNYTNNMLTNDNKNPKRFWNFIKSRKKDSTGVAPLKKEGLTFSDSLNKANIMGDQFCSVFTQEDMSELPDLGQSRTPSVHPIKVNIKGVLKFLKDIKPHKATGPDNIPGRLLKEAAEELAHGLAHLFQISIDNGKNPIGLEVSPRHSGLQEGKPFNTSKLPTNLAYVYCV